MVISTEVTVGDKKGPPGGSVSSGGVYPASGFVAGSSGGRLLRSPWKSQTTAPAGADGEHRNVTKWPRPHGEIENSLPQVTCGQMRTLPASIPADGAFHRAGNNRALTSFRPDPVVVSL